VRKNKKIEKKSNGENTLVWTDSLFFPAFLPSVLPAVPILHMYLNSKW